MGERTGTSQASSTTQIIQSGSVTSSEVIETLGHLHVSSPHVQDHVFLFLERALVLLE